MKQNIEDLHPLIVKQGFTLFELVELNSTLFEEIGSSCKSEDPEEQIEQLESQSPACETKSHSL